MFRILYNFCLFILLKKIIEEKMCMKKKYGFGNILIIFFLKNFVYLL